MDPGKLECYEFLDLSDVDEHERRELKQTLFSESTPDFLQLPWTNNFISEEWQKGPYDDESGDVPNGPVVLAGSVCPPLSDQSGPVPAVAQHVPAVSMYSQPPAPYSVPPPTSGYQHPQSVFANVSMHGYVTGHYVPPHYTMHEPPDMAGRGHRGRSRGRGTKRNDVRMDTTLVESTTAPGFNPQFVPIHYHPAYYPASVGTPMQHPSPHNATGSPLYIAPVYTHMYGAYPPHGPQYYPAPNTAHVNSIMEDTAPDMSDLSLEPQPVQEQPIYQQHTDDDIYNAEENVMTNVMVNNTANQINCHVKQVTETYLNNNHIEITDTQDKKPVVEVKTSAKSSADHIKTEPVVKVSAKSTVEVVKNDTTNSALQQNVNTNAVTLHKVATAPPHQTPESIPVNNIQTELKTNVDIIKSSTPSVPESVVSVHTKVEPEEPAPPPSKSWASLFQNSSASSQVTNTDTTKSNVKSMAAVTNATKSAEEKLSERNTSEPKTVHVSPPSYSNDPNSYRMGEFLTKYTLDNRIVSVQPRGLTNRSNYCYINSILQALLACPPFYNLLKAMPLPQRKTSSMKTPMPIIDSMIDFVNEFTPLAADARLNRKEKGQRKDNIDVICGTSFEPSRIYKILNGIRSDTFIVEGRQEDAEEFFGCLVNGLNDEMLELMKLVDPAQNHENLSNGDIANNKEGDGQDEVEWKVMGPKNKGSITRKADFGRTPISDIFRGQLRSRVHRTGDQVTDNVQPFFTLQLDIEKATSVYEALELLVNKDKLEGVTCSRTNQQVEAWQQVMIEELPLVMVLHLKCFHYKLDACSKIIKALDFPIDLKIDSKLLSSKAKYTGKQKQYKLFAVVYHDGKEATKGHYLTDAYHAGYGGWVRYDDATVKSVQESYVLHPNASRVPYLLFYRRCDTIGSQQQQTVSKRD